MFQVLTDVTYSHRKELEGAGLLYWRCLPRHAEWRPCPRLRHAPWPSPPYTLTPERVHYAVAMLDGGMEYAISVEE